LIKDLDLTTDETPYRAYISASPTVVDLDQDGNLDVLVPTGVGFVYKISHQGKNLGSLSLFL
jgi:hypothetical protein